MGRTITQLVAGRDDCEITCGVDIRQPETAAYPVFATFAECNVESDVIIDFSNPTLLEPLIAYARERNMPVVLCTTGYSEQQLESINWAASDIPVFKTGNLSLGINLLISLAKKATEVLGDSFDIEIVEQHHNQKLDAPSGTALMIADSIAETLDTSPTYEYDRHSRRRKRDHNEIGIHSVRGGTITGVHEVIFAGANEEVVLTHRAESKGVFAAGAVSAARYMVGKPAGMYDMNSLIKDTE